MKLRTVQDRVIVKKIDLELKTAGGIFLGEIESDRDTCYGLTIKVGPGRVIDNTGPLPMDCKEGEIVNFNPAVAKRFEYRGEHFFLIRNTDINFVNEDKELVVKPFVSEKLEERQAKRLG